MSKIKPEDYQKSLDRMTEIFADIVSHADQQASERCPYRDSKDRCSAKFGCQNQRRPDKTTRVLICGGDENIDYRSAWEANPDAVAEMKKTLINAGKKGAAENVVKVNCHGEVAELETGSTLFQFADAMNIRLPSSCGQQGICHECIVEIKEGSGSLSERTEAESFLQQDYRLGCQAKVMSGEAAIEFTPLRRSPNILTMGQEKEFTIDPLVSHHGDGVYYEDEKIDDYRGHLYGLAIDLGTTTIVMDLVDLHSGHSVHISSFENPQRFGGSDVMSRISYDAKHPGELRKTLVAAINDEIMNISYQLGFHRAEIYEVVVAGNATMRDLFFGLDVQGIGQKPYRSVTETEMHRGERESTSLLQAPRTLKIRVNPKARIYSPPLIGCHVGADTAACLANIDLADEQRTVMLMDVGTNTEVIVCHQGRILAASCPAGPAFEGGLTRFGMPGHKGAIDSFSWNGASFEFSTLGGGEPQGICGSGLIDLLAELRRNELMTAKGVFSDRRQREMLLVPDAGISLSREDASNLAQAKAANYCGQYIVLRKMGLNPEDIDVLYLAGGFANYVDSANAVEIGFIAPVPGERIYKIGNASLKGAREILLSRSTRETIEQLATNIEHIELETTPDFFEIFVDACQFNPMPENLTFNGDAGAKADSSNLQDKQA